MAPTQTLRMGPAPSEARAVCVFLHGRGQTPGEMAEHVIGHLDAPNVRFVLPKAPREAWYDARAVDPLNDATLTQLNQAIAVVDGVMRTARDEAREVPLVLAGFSQGACLALEYLMRGGHADAAVLFTACRVGAVADDLPSRDLAGMPVYHSNGSADPWVPLWASQKAVSELATQGVRLRTDVLPGRPHEVAASELSAFSGLLQAICARREPFRSPT